MYEYMDLEHLWINKSTLINDETNQKIPSMINMCYS